MDRLRALWDFDDLELTQRRFEEQLAHEPDDAGRAEVLTQLARVEGLRGAFDACAKLLDEAERLGGGMRVPLERGRMFRSSGDVERAYPLFVEAFDRAGDPFLAGDAAHMAALADPAGPHAWTERGLELADREPDAAYWRGPLLNNLGWHLQEAGEHEAALAAFERALRAREDDPEKPYAIELAHYAVAVALRSLGRAAEAAAHAEHAVAWAEANGVPAPYFHEELAADYEALGRHAEAAVQREQAEAAR